MRVLVCGGRHFADRERLFKKLDDMREQMDVLIHGMAPGADTLADIWAQAQKVKVISCRAEWRKYGLQAGPIRNQRMIDEGKPDLCVAFPGGRGTADMVRRCKTAGIKVVEG